MTDSVTEPEEQIRVAFEEFQTGLRFEVTGKVTDAA